MASENQTTLPDRLRKLAAGWVTTYPHARDTVAAMNEAADEIERLRAEISSLELRLEAALWEQTDIGDGAIIATLCDEARKYKKAWNDISDRYEALLVQLGGTDA